MGFITFPDSTVVVQSEEIIGLDIVSGEAGSWLLKLYLRGSCEPMSIGSVNRGRLLHLHAMILDLVGGAVTIDSHD